MIDILVFQNNVANNLFNLTAEIIKITLIHLRECVTQSQTFIGKKSRWLIFIKGENNKIQFIGDKILQLSLQDQLTVLKLNWRLKTNCMTKFIANFKKSLIHVFYSHTSERCESSNQLYLISRTGKMVSSYCV